MAEQLFLNENDTEVRGFQLTPSNLAEFEEWAGTSARLRLASGGYIIYKKDGTYLGIIDLGDYLIMKSNGQLVIEVADGFYQRYTNKDGTPV